MLIGKSVTQHAWRGSLPVCDSVLEDPLDGNFGGAFNNSARPVVLHVIGDSISRQLRSSLHAVAATNAWLGHLQIPKPCASLAVLPGSSIGAAKLASVIAGCKARHITGTKFAKHVVVFNAGVWYGPSDSIRLCSARDQQQGTRTECQQAGQGLIRPNHDSPSNTPPFNTTSCCGWYNLARKWTGTTTANEYAADVRTFAAALKTATQQSNVSLFWFESTPQHFADDLTGAGTYNPQADHQSCVRKLTHSAGNFNYLNRVSGPIMADLDIPTIPIFYALEPRGDLHIEFAGDCTHWCEPSEVTLHMAAAVLNTVARCH
jgi:hypothetical protein